MSMLRGARGFVMPVFVVPLVLVGLAGTPGEAWPAEVTKGPPGNAFGHVHALGISADGRTLWLGAHTGLFRSEEGGKRWEPVKLAGHDGHQDVMALVADPKDPRTVYVATHEAGVFRTLDGGASWTGISSGLGGADVHGIALDPGDPRKLHAAVRGKGEGVYRTGDAGTKWVRVDDGPPGEVKVLASVGISTGMGGIFLYAGTAQGLLRSPDCF